ncbi:hypothetical protein R8Z50_07865 [Longispora sp. K20-0274]|uniref:hypothetical protein n=1 Tax=Longispora sp. K20-0274 TaxID=3088255 RepID=UPI00399A230E
MIASWWWAFVMVPLPLTVVAWLGLARTRRFRLAVTGVLLLVGLGAILVIAGLVVDDAAPTRVEAMVLLGPALLLFCGAGALAESWWLRRDPAGSVERGPGRRVVRRVARSALGVAVLWSLCCGAGSWPVDLLELREGADQVMVVPFPDDLVVTSVRNDCGSSHCSMVFDVAARDGAPAGQVTERVWRHLAGKGWRRNAAWPDEACRRPGWLFGDPACVSVHPSVDQPDRLVTVLLG